MNLLFSRPLIALAFVSIVSMVPASAIAQVAVLGYKINAENQIADSGFNPSLEGPAGLVTLSGNPYNSGFVAPGTYISRSNAPSGWNAYYWLCYNQTTSCTVPNFVQGQSVQMQLLGSGQSGDHVTLWWKYTRQETGAAIIGLRVGEDNQPSSGVAATPTLVGPTGVTTQLVGNPFNSNFVSNGRYISYANAPSGYTPSYWLCKGNGTVCTTPRFVEGASVEIQIEGTRSESDVVTLWWKYSPPRQASCTFNGSTVAHGESVIAYQATSVPVGQQCLSERRTCNNGTLSGTYAAVSCAVQSGTPVPAVVPGAVPAVTSEWNRGTTLLRNFVNMYNGHVHVEPGAAYPYKMWFFGWAAHTCNNPAWPSGVKSCDAIFYARSLNGTAWEVYAGNSQSGEPVFDATQNPALWKSVISAQDTYYDQGHNGDPSVVKVGSTYYMVYSATGPDRDGIEEGKTGDTDQNFQGIMAAVSTDGINWRKATRPYFVSPHESGGRDTAPGNMYHRPSLMYEQGKFKMWFDYWVSDARGLSMGYAELPMVNPTADSFLNASWQPLRVGENPLIVNWPNPNVVKVGSQYYSYADPVVTSAPGWPGRQITEAVSSDGINWRITGYVEPESGCAANHVPEAYVDGAVLYVTYGCQVGGSPTYDYRYSQIRRMSKSISDAGAPATAGSPSAALPYQISRAVPPAQVVTPVSTAVNAVEAQSCPRLVRNLSRGARGADVRLLQTFLHERGILAADGVTGYFGLMTERAVQEYQRVSSLVSYGTPSTTGYGAVGPKTRIAIAACR